MSVCRATKTDLRRVDSSATFCETSGRLANDTWCCRDGSARGRASSPACTPGQDQCHHTTFNFHESYARLYRDTPLLSLAFGPKNKAWKFKRGALPRARVCDIARTT